MKNYLSIVGLIMLATACSLCGQSLYESDLDRLIEDHDQAVAAAVEPINRHYKVELEQLLDRAIKNKDLDVALRIRARLTALAQPSPAPWRRPTSAEELTKFLVGTTWKNGDDTFTFLADGTFRQKNGNTNPWYATGANTFKLWNYDIATLNTSLTQFTAVGYRATYTCTLESDPAEITNKEVPTVTPAPNFGSSHP